MVKKFYGNDPVEGEKAANEILTTLEAEAIKALVPLDQGVYRHSPQIEIRLKYMASKLGEQIVPQEAIFLKVSQVIEDALRS